MEAQKEECDEELLVTVVRDCSEEILCKYPSTLIIFAHYALLNGQYKFYEKLCRMIRLIVQEKTDLMPEEIRRLTGELIVLESLGEFNDLSKMLVGYETAIEILGESPDIMENSTPWLAVFLTAAGIFWRDVGKLDETMDIIDELKPIYRKLNRGEAAGLDYLIRAEVMLLRGEDNEAEILCHKALYKACVYEQVSICIYAQFCLARVFLIRGDIQNFSDAIENIRGYGVKYADLAVQRMVDISMSIISVLLGNKDGVAPWFYSIEGIRKSLYAPLIPFAEMVYLNLLLIDKRYNELYAVCQLALDDIRNPGAKIKYVMPQVHYLIMMAVAKYNNGDPLEAGRYLNEALDLSLPDRIYLPFADHECMIELLSGLNRRNFERDHSDSLLSLCKRNMKGVTIIKGSISNKSPLTPREREIALLAKERLSAKEIGAKLFISERTVKSTLGSVYSNLGINSKKELVLKEF